MATMTIQNTPVSGGLKVPARFQYEDSLSAAGNGAWCLFPQECESLGVLLYSSGDGRVEITFAKDADIAANTAPAESIKIWPHGNIGIDKAETSISKCAAFRQVNISGTTKMYAVGA